jgi:hypothetical protein
MYGNARGDNFYLGTLGTSSVVVSDKPATVKRLVWGGTYVGTIAVYDSATVAGTAASNQIISIGLPLTRYPESVEIDARTKNGIVVTHTGTPTHTLIWGE